MPAAVKHEPSRTHRESSIVSIVSGWAQQGVQTFFATQRILLDLAMRQNANIMHALQEQLSHPHHSPAAILSEVAGEGMTNFIEGHKVLLDLGKQQNEILMTAVKERVGEHPAAYAVAELLSHSVETFIHMQQEFLKIAGKQTHTWMEAAKSGKPYQPEHLMDLAQEGMETFIKAQKEFLDVIAEETTKVTSGKRTNGATKKLKKTELAEVARNATESFIEAQKKLVDIAGHQMNANVKTAGKAMELLRPFPFVPFSEITREAVKSYVDAQKALMDAMVHPSAKHAKPEKHAKRPTRATKKEMAVAATA
jgi:predicted nucleic-acid-binding protein